MKRLCHDFSRWPRTIVGALLAIAAIPAALLAQTSSHAEARGAATPQTAANGIKVGDAIEVVTGFGWTPAKVVAINGNS